MCGRFNNHLPRMLGWAEMLSEWPENYVSGVNQSEVAQSSTIFESFNVAPTSTIAAFADIDKSFASTPQAGQALQSIKLFGKPMRWGMIPGWSNSFDSKYATFNARIETIAEKPTFRSAWKRQQRCLIPMAGYYEWQATKQAGTKQPFYITDKNVGGLVAAGLYEVWGPANDVKLSCTMITRPADPGLDSIHHRMPVLLDPQSAGQWLECAAPHAEQLLNELVSPDVIYWPVGTAVGNVRNDNEKLCAPIDLITA